MNCRKILIIFTILFVIKCASNNKINYDLKNLFYNTTSGMYKAKLVELKGHGFDSPKYLHKLISIPYAEKPERFQQSILKNYQESIQESRDPVACYQSVNLSSYGLFVINEAPHMTEDCLTVNLYIPIATNQEEEKELKNMSVVIHIHGGSNMVGGAGLFDGSILATKGRIVVAIINYRLSIFGFLSDMTERFPGNYGLRDQILAIQWIKMNCKVLNCNPNSITLWGHSAGAGDVNWLTISPLSSNLFQRVIIQSGSSFSYWGYDRMPFERYRALKKYFNCTNLPDTHTNENKAMTKLIETCLSKVPLEDLFSFKFALIDAPGPTYDGFLKFDSLINEYSPRDMIKNADFIGNIDILTGINGVEGFSFEGYFSSSVKFFTQNNLTNEVMLTIERFSLLTREKCKQNLLIENRLNIEEYYEKKVKKYIKNETSLANEEVKRLKAIFANSDAIFDSGFIELLKQIANKKKELEQRGFKTKKSNLFVYEYLHENSGSQQNLETFKKHLVNYSMSTHFDGIDLVFGLPIAYKNQNISKENLYDYPFRNFTFENGFSDEEANLSLALITYYSNFIKNGDPNIGDQVNAKWEPYSNNNAFLKLNTNLLQKKDIQLNSTHDLREDLYKFWFVNMTKNGNCNSYEFNSSYNEYQGSMHTQGSNPTLDKCFSLLNNSTEYNHLREMFLMEYENCMNKVDYSVALKTLFNTVCLDLIAIRRLLIEYELCCTGNTTEVWSTICSLKNFNKKFIDYNMTRLIDFAIKSATTIDPSVSGTISFNKIMFNYVTFIKYFCCFLLSLFNLF